MKPDLRKFVLTAHIAFSVGWLGAVGAFLVLAVAGLFSRNAQPVRAAYPAMEIVGWYVIVPSGFATLLIGLIQSFGTKWGLVRHYWILIKFLITLGAVIILVLHMQATSRLASVAIEMPLSDLDFRPLQIRLVVDAAAALIVLLIATLLSVYKPWGLTGYGRRKQLEQSGVTAPDGLETGIPWGRYVMIGLGGIVLLFVIVHLAGGGLGPHGH